MNPSLIPAWWLLDCDELPAVAPGGTYFTVAGLTIGSLTLAGAVHVPTAAAGRVLVPDRCGTIRRMAC